MMKRANILTLENGQIGEFHLAYNNKIITHEIKSICRIIRIDNSELL